MPSGAELFVEALQKLGIGEIFTLVGDHLNEVLLEAARRGLRIIDMRHESGVTHAAEQWARLNRRPAVSLVTGGPGHTNSLTGIAAAYLATSPLIAVSGSRATTVTERGAFQDIQQVEMTRPVVKWAAEPPSAGEIPRYLQRAYQEANAGRRGPVHLTIPVDLFTSKVENPAAMSGVPAPAPSEPGSDDVAAALALLRRAERPVVIAGSGVWWADAAEELRLFVEKTSLPLYTITMARGIVPDEHPLCMGYGDPALNRAALEAFRSADVVLVLGKRIDYRLAFGGARLFAASARFIQVDVHPQELGMNRQLAVALCADAKSTLQALSNASGPGSWSALPWLDHVRTLRRKWEESVSAQTTDSGTPLHPAAFFGELKKHLRPDVCYAWDGGDFVHWGRVLLPAVAPGLWYRLGPLGAIGSALPNAIALKMAHTDRPVVMITGDGSLGFYLAELDSLVRHKLPVVLIVGNDGGWGLERELQSQSSRTTVACELARSRYELVMQGFGGGGESVETIDQVGPAIQRALASGVPYCLNVMIRGVRSPFTEWQIAGKKR